MTNRSPLEVLIATRRHFDDETKWRKGAFVDLDTTDCFCLIGALAFFASGNPFDIDSTKEERQLLTIASNADKGHLSGWNDARCRTIEDVRIALDKAIELTKAES